MRGIVYGWGEWDARIGEWSGVYFGRSVEMFGDGAYAGDDALGGHESQLPFGVGAWFEPETSRLGWFAALAR